MPAAGDQAVDVLRELHHRQPRLRGTGRRPGPPHPRAAPPWRSPCGAGPPGRLRCSAAPEPRRERGVAGLDAEPRGVGGDVWPVLVDDGHDAQRHPHPLDLEPVRAPPPSSISPTGSGKEATWRNPDAMPSIRASLSRKRSSRPASMPPAAAAAGEVRLHWPPSISALAARRAPRRRRAAPAFLLAVDAGPPVRAPPPCGPATQLHYRRRHRARLSPPVPVIGSVKSYTTDGVDDLSSRASARRRAEWCLRATRRAAVP